MIDPKFIKDISEFLAQRGVKTSTTTAQLIADEYLYNFTVANIMNIDLLKYIKSEIEVGINQGMGQQEFVKYLQQRLIESGWVQGDDKTLTPSRLKLIYDTNYATATALGAYERGQSSKAHQYIKYIYTFAAKDPRIQHEKLNGVILPKDDPFWAKAFPPNGFGCHCQAVYLTKSQAERMGITDKADVPKLDDIVDKGFAYLPTKRLQVIKEQIKPYEVLPVADLKNKAITIKHETNKALLLVRGNVEFWVQKKWYKADGTLTPAGEKSYQEGLEKYNNTRQNQINANKELQNGKVEGVAVYGDVKRETEKALLIEIDKIGNKPINMWVAKSNILTQKDKKFVLKPFVIENIYQAYDDTMSFNNLDIKHGLADEFNDKRNRYDITFHEK